MTRTIRLAARQALLEQRSFWRSAEYALFTFAFPLMILLLTAIGGCTAVDVDILTSRRAEPEKFEIVVDADKVRGEAGNRLTDIVVTFRIRFPEGEDGDKARELLPDAVRKSHDRLCTVSRTVELGTPIADRIE